MITREEVLQLDDQQLLDYYAASIKAFDEIKQRYEDAEELKRKWKKLNRQSEASFILYLVLIFIGVIPICMGFFFPEFLFPLSALGVVMILLGAFLMVSYLRSPVQYYEIEMQVMARAKYNQACDEIKDLISNPQGNLSDALVMFKDETDIKELYDIVHNGLARNHTEAMKELQRRKEHRETVDAIKDMNRKSILDKAEQLGRIGSGLFGFFR